MAEAKLPREPDQGFVGRLVPDPAAPPELRLLVGYPGASSAEGHVRLYASPDLGGWWDIPEDAVLHRRAIPGDPLGAEILWIRRDQQPVLNQGRSEAMYTTLPPTYFYCGPGPVIPPTQGYGCGPGPAVPQTQPAAYFGTLWAHCTPPAQANAAVAQQPTQICTIPPPTVGCPPPVHPTWFGLCTIPPVTIGCHPQEMQTWVRPPQTQDVNCGTSPVGGAQAQQAQAQQTVQPTTHFTIPPQSMCCPPQTVQPTIPFSIPPQTMCCPAR